jgi:hypothetical protein
MRIIDLELTRVLSGTSNHGFSKVIVTEPIKGYKKSKFKGLM